MSLELFIGKKKQKTTSEEKDADKPTPLPASRDKSEVPAPSRTLSQLPLKEITIDELEKRSSHEILSFLSSAVRQHPLYSYHVRVLEELLANDSSLEEKTLKELSILLQISEGFLLGLLLSIK